MKKTSTLQLALLLAILAGFAVSARAAAPIPFTLEEVSSSVLTYSVNGGAAVTVNAGTLDNWDFSIPDFVVSSFSSDQDLFINWEEPDYATSGLVNEVRFQQNGNGTEITVISDHLPSGDFQPGYPLVVNGGVYDFLNSQSAISGGLTAQFTDDGDEPSTVPDAGSSCLLLLISAGLLLAFQRRQARLVA